MFVFGAIYETIWQKKMLQRPKYTIGIATTDWHHKNNNGVGTDYNYEIAKQTFSSTTNWSYKKGSKFLIIYDSIKPKNAVVLSLYNIKETNIVAPLNGWKYSEVPILIDSVIIRKFVEDWNIKPYEYDNN